MSDHLLHNLLYVQFQQHITRLNAHFRYTSLPFHMDHVILRNYTE